MPCATRGNTTKVSQLPLWTAHTSTSHPQICSTLQCLPARVRNCFHSHHPTGLTTSCTAVAQGRVAACKPWCSANNPNPECLIPALWKMPATQNSTQIALNCLQACTKALSTHNMDAQCPSMCPLPGLSHTPQAAQGSQYC